MLRYILRFANSSMRMAHMGPQVHDIESAPMTMEFHGNLSSQVILFKINVKHPVSNVWVCLRLQLSVLQTSPTKFRSNRMTLTERRARARRTKRMTRSCEVSICVAMAAARTSQCNMCYFWLEGTWMTVMPKELGCDGMARQE